ncbi:MAG: polyprenyl synthetase family protein [Stappiaceae bacterium]
MALPVENQQNHTAGISNLVELVSEDMGAVNNLILSKAGSNVEMIPEVARHLISSGGKRLRPMLTLAAAQMYGYNGEGHVVLAASVEFMHTATLLHDDVVDESDVRRGKLAARKVWGNQASVLVGDYMLGQAFKMMVDVGSLEALDILSSASAVIAEGEVMQLGAAQDLSTGETEYLAVINAKTAALFSAAMEVGPVIAGGSDAAKQACREYGLNLGLAFQLIDDALDYGGSSDALGKNVGDDFREGKITMPVILAYRAGDDAEKAFWQRCIEQGEITENDLENAISLIQKHDAITGTVQKAKDFGELAKSACARMPDCPQARALCEVVAFCVNRAS